MQGWLVIARRELLERVRTVWFMVVTLLGPVAMIGVLVVPQVLAHETANEGVRVVVVDPDGEVGPTIVSAMQQQGWRAELATPDDSTDHLLHRIKEDEIDGFLTLPRDVTAAQLHVVPYHGDNATNQVVMLAMNTIVAESVLKARFRKYGIGDEQIEEVLQPTAVEPIHTTGDTEGSSGTGLFIVGYAVMFILYMSIVLYAVNVMRSVVMEKTNRVVEIMVAAAKPRALMFGKILGVGAAGLIQIAAWATMAILSVHYRGEILGVFGVKDAGGWNIPALGLDAVAIILAYFLLGYFFYASIYAAIGAMVSSDQEAQQAQTPVILLLIVPMMCMQLVANNPRGGGAQLLTILPFSAPILMPMRYLLDGASRNEVILSLALLAASTWLVAWLAGRIYRVGILLYGKRPSLRELARWIRYS